MGGVQLPNIAFGEPVSPYTVSAWDGGTLASAFEGMVYWPSPLEFDVALGVIALGFLVFFVGVKCFSLRRSFMLGFWQKFPHTNDYYRTFSPARFARGENPRSEKAMGPRNQWFPIEIVRMGRKMSK